MFLTDECLAKKTPVESPRYPSPRIGSHLHRKDCDSVMGSSYRQYTWLHRLFIPCILIPRYYYLGSHEGTVQYLSDSAPSELDLSHHLVPLSVSCYPKLFFTSRPFFSNLSLLPLTVPRPLALSPSRRARNGFSSNGYSQHSCRDLRGNSTSTQSNR